MPQEAHVLKAWSPDSGAIRAELETLMRWVEEVGSWGACPWGYIMQCPFLCFLYFLSTMRWATLLFHALSHDILPQQGQKQ